jgi:hypothetical protein
MTMALRVSHTTFNALDAYQQSVWWAELLGYHEDPEDPNLPGHEECMISSADGSHRILFIDVPDAKQARNRVHLDLQAVDRRRDEEVERVLALGATLVDDLRKPDGTGWAVLADPEGNEFCVLRSDVVRAAQDPAS